MSFYIVRALISDQHDKFAAGSGQFETFSLFFDHEICQLRDSGPKLLTICFWCHCPFMTPFDQFFDFMLNISHPRRLYSKGLFRDSKKPKNRKFNFRAYESQPSSRCCSDTSFVFTLELFCRMSCTKLRMCCSACRSVFRILSLAIRSEPVATVNCIACWTSSWDFSNVPICDAVAPFRAEWPNSRISSKIRHMSRTFE